MENDCHCSTKSEPESERGVDNLSIGTSNGRLDVSLRIPNNASQYTQWGSKATMGIRKQESTAWLPSSAPMECWKEEEVEMQKLQGAADKLKQDHKTLESRIVALEEATARQLKALITGQERISATPISKTPHAILTESRACNYRQNVEPL